MQMNLLTKEMTDSVLTGLTHHVVPSQVLPVMGTAFGHLEGYSWLFTLLENLWPPIMGGALIILLVQTIGAAYQLTLGELATCIKKIKWAVIGVFFLTVVPKLLRIIVDAVTTMSWM